VLAPVVFGLLKAGENYAARFRAAGQ